MNVAVKQMQLVGSPNTIDLADNASRAALFGPQPLNQDYSASEMASNAEFHRALQVDVHMFA